MCDGVWGFLMNALAITNTAGTPNRRTPSELIRIDRARGLVSKHFKRDAANLGF